MKSFIVIFASFFAINLFAGGSQEISGQVTASAELQKTLAPNGILFIFAKNVGGAGGPPAAVLRVPSPKFPVSFSLSEKNSMMGAPFKGPFTVSARYSASGDAMDKSGPQGTDEKHKSINVGEKDIQIELKAK